MGESVAQIIEELKTEKDVFKKAKIVQYLYKDKMISLKEIAFHIKVHPSYISHYISILRLPEIVLDGYYSKDISSAHLFLLARLKSSSEIIKAYETILAKALTTAQTEELIREIKFDVVTYPTRLDKKELEEMAQNIVKKYPSLGIKIYQNRVRGKIILELKGNSKITSEFLRDVAEKLINLEKMESYDDEFQVLE